MKIGDKVFVHGYVDEIRKDIIIIRNEGGYFGTVPDEILPSARPEYRLDEWCTDCKEYDIEKHYCPRFNQVIRTTLDEMKSERKRGKWIYKNDLKQFFCSECGYPSLTYDDTYIYGMDLPNYCEDCGADMRGGQDE